jgi:neutral ceramidase
MSNDAKGIISWSVKDDEKHEMLLEGIVTSVVEAFNSRKPARMGYGKGNVKRCGYNRRYIMSDGRSKMNPHGVGNPDRLMVEGPVDSEVQVIWFEEGDGNRIAVMVNFSSHPVTLFSTEYISADFPGAMRKDIQALYESNLPVLYLQGACGNIDTYDFENDFQWGKGMEGYKRIGRILAGEVIKIISQGYAEEMPEGVFSVLNRMIRLPYKKIDQDEVDEIRSQWEQMTEEEKEKMPFEQKVYQTRLMYLERLINQNGTHEIEITVLILGDLVIATVPGEYFVEYQLALKKKFHDYKVIVLELANGGVGYIPTKQAVALGGYEAISTIFSGEAGSMILDGWVEMLAKKTGRK